MSFTIRKVLPSEAALLIAISRSTFIEAFDETNTPENMRHYLDTHMTEAVLATELEDTRSSFWFITEEEQVCGYLKLNKGDAQKESMGKDAVELERIYISKAYWAAGLGQQLLDHAVAQAVESGAKRLWLGVWEHNERALRFYRRNGFTACGSHKFVMGDDVQTDILMERSL